MESPTDIEIGERDSGKSFTARETFPDTRNYPAPSPQPYTLSVGDTSHPDFVLTSQFSPFKNSESTMAQVNNQPCELPRWRQGYHFHMRLKRCYDWRMVASPPQLHARPNVPFVHSRHLFEVGTVLDLACTLPHCFSLALVYTNGRTRK